VATLTVLENSLQEFNGAVILVTHDRYFMDQVASHIMAFHKNSDGNTTLENFTGYLQWEEWFDEQKELRAAEIKRESEQKKESKSDKNIKLSFKEKFELEKMEGAILELETKLEGLQKESARPEVVSDSVRLQELFKDISETQALIEKNYLRWAELEKKAQRS
jgi:ATP-binding cassette subfamily F protein uup